MIDSYLLSILRYVEVKVDIWCIDKTHFFSIFFFFVLGGGDGWTVYNIEWHIARYVLVKIFFFFSMELIP